MNIAFFGTSDRSLPILEALNSSFNLVLCVTKPDVQVGRKHELKSSEVKNWAKQKNIEVFETNSLKADMSTLIELLHNKHIELGVVADFSLIIPQRIINSMKHGLINVHFSLLPKLRGASPVQFAILNGDTETGITFFLIDKGMDEGKILYQVTYKLNGSETSGNLYRILFSLAGENITHVINKYLNNELKSFSQDEANATYTYSPTHPRNTFIYKEDAKINWSNGPEKIYRQIRAYYPWPISWTTLGEMNQFLKELGYIVHERHDPSLKIKVHEAVFTNSKLSLITIQPENSKKMSWNDFANGYLIKI